MLTRKGCPASRYNRLWNCQFSTENCAVSVSVVKAQMKLGECFVGTSLLETEFHCRIDTELDLNGTRAISPIISGRAWIIGTKQLMVDPADPFQGGYRLSDTWPMDL